MKTVKPYTTGLPQVNHIIIHLERKIDSQGYYSRKNCILMHDIRESNGEDTDEISVEILRDKLGA